MSNEALFSFPVRDFVNFSATTQQELSRRYGFPFSGVPAAAAPKAGSAGSTSSEEDGPSELTVALVRKLTENLSPKTLTAVRVIAQSPTPEFHMKDVIKAIDGAADYMDLRGVWSGLTRRTRKLLGSDADLIWWIGDDIRDDDDNYVDHIGQVSKMTHDSLKAHFKI